MNTTAATDQNSRAVAQAPSAPQTGPSATQPTPNGAADPAAPAFPTTAFPTTAWTPPPAPVAPRTNVLGVVTLVLGILGFAIVPVITGHIALNQIKRTGEDGRAVTLVGLILGYVALAGYVVAGLVFLAIAFFATVAGVASAGYAG
jgi:hypothetical protein